MDIDSGNHHSLQQIDMIHAMSRRPDLTPREALFLATQLVNHGFANAGDYVMRLQKLLQSPAANYYLNRLAVRHRIIQSSGQLSRTQADASTARQLLGTSGFVFRPGSFRNDTAVVIFTTKYNNFGVSNIVADALFAELGVSRLFLKDASDFIFFRGVDGLCSELNDIPAAVTDFLAARGVRNMILTGFSTGGYASLHAACRAACIGHVGYAVTVDLSPQSGLPQFKSYERLRKTVAPDHFADLTPMVASQPPDKRFRMFYGEREPVDRAQAMRLSGIPNVEITGHPEAGHEVPLRLLEDGVFFEPFAALLKAV